MNPPPPPAEGFASRLFAGPALRTQSDRRLVKLVREGYESAFEEIVRRYAKPLGRYAAAIVGGRSEDVTQDAFSKALLALRGQRSRDRAAALALPDRSQHGAQRPPRRPSGGVELIEPLAGGTLSAAEEPSGARSSTELMKRLRALPEPQRAAIVMRELEGLGHEEIAAPSGSAAAPRARRSSEPGRPCATVSGC